MENNNKKIKVLGIGFDYQSIVAAQTRGDFYARFVEISKHLDGMIRIIYCPKSAGLQPIKVGETGQVVFTNSTSKLHYYKDLLRLAKQVIPTGEFNVIAAEDPLFAGLAGVMLKAKFKIPLNVQTFDSRINNKYWIRENRKNIFLNMIANFVLKRADTIRVVAEYTKKVLMIAGIPAEKIFVVPTIVDTSKFENVDGRMIRNKYLKEGKNKIILFVGRLSKEKNLPMLIRAFHAIHPISPEAILLIVGGGPEKENLLQLVAELGLDEEVLFTGPVEYDLIPQYHAAADIFVLPSFHEGRANVLVEAALSKTAIIATNVGDANQCVSNNATGFIIGNNDFGELTKKLNYLLRNEEQLKGFAAAGYDRIVNYLKSINSDEYIINIWKNTAVE